MCGCITGSGFRQPTEGLRYVPAVMVTDKLASYSIACQILLPSVEPRRSKYLNTDRQFSSPTGSEKYYHHTCESDASDSPQSSIDWT